LRDDEKCDGNEHGQSKELTQVHNLAFNQEATRGPRLAGPQVFHADQVSVATSTTASAKA
jgi:hypothetical protein